VRGSRLFFAAAALLTTLAVIAPAATAAKRPVKVYVNEYEFGFKLSRETVPADGSRS
jgi:hypothetical protein